MEIRATQAAGSLPFVARNLSGSGVFLHATRVYPAGTELTLEFELPYSSGKIRTTAKVVRHSTDPATGLINGMGLEFTSRTDEIAGMIEAYLQQTEG